MDTGLATMESRLGSMTESSEASGPETVTAEPRTIAAISASEEQHSASAMLNQHGSQKHETVDTETHASTLCHRAVEDTRFIPVRPITPFTPIRATAGEFVEDEHLCSSTGPHQYLVSAWGRKLIPFRYFTIIRCQHGSIYSAVNWQVSDIHL